MNRSTNLFYKKNTRLHLSEPFMPSFPNLPTTTRPLPTHYSLKDTYDPTYQRIDTYTSSAGVTRDSSYPMSSSQATRGQTDYQPSSSSPYKPFFPHATTIQNPTTSRFSHDFNMRLQAQNMQPLSNYIKKDDKSVDLEKNNTLAEAYQKSQLQALASQQYLYQGSSQTSFLSPQQPKLEGTAHSSIFRYPSEPTINATNRGLYREGKPGPFLTMSQSLEEETQGFFGDAEHGVRIDYQGGSPQVYLGEKRVVKRVKDEKLSAKAEELMEIVDKHELNSISLLNEVSGKLKKKVEYQVTETSTGRNKVFECSCLLDGRIIGIKKGNSKQNAKTEAAKVGIRTILMDDQHITEGAAIILAIQKGSEKALKKERSDKSNLSVLSEDKLTSASEMEVISENVHENDQIQSESTLDDDIIRQSLQSASKKEKTSQNTKSALYELNIFARKYSTEPVWSFPLDTNEDGEFEIGLQFGDLNVQEKGRKKQEAKKEAAAKMVSQIQECQKLGKPVCSDPGRASAKARDLFITKREDRAKNLFQKSLKPTILERLQYDESDFKPIVQDNNIDFESHVTSLLQKHQPDVVSNENLQVFFKKVMDYTSMATSNPKQVMLDAKRHLADYVKDCYLVPIGSFALGCMRNNNLAMDSLLMFHEVNNISDHELLEIYKHSLETCYCLDQQSGTNVLKMNFQFNIKTNEQGASFMEVVETGKTNGKAKLNIYVFNQTYQSAVTNQVSAVNGAMFPIVHVQKIYGSLDRSVEELTAFRNLLSVMKIWTYNTGLDAIRSELIEAILLNVILNSKCSKIKDNVINSLNILSSEKLTQATLSIFGQQYQGLYEAMSVESRQELKTVSQKSLSCIYQNNFSEAQLF